MPIALRRLSKAALSAAFTAALIGALAAALAGCAVEPPPNVLLLVSDAMRAQSLSCYGGPAATPNICSLAEEGVLFERAYANAPWTLPSVVAMFTGTYPLQHRRTRQGRAGKPLPFYFVSGDETLLPEALAERGYRATSVVENTVARQPQVLQGVYDLSLPQERWAAEEARVRELAGGGLELEPWNHGFPPLVWSLGRLLEPAAEPWLHLHWFDDPHAPYRPPARLREAAGLPTDDLPQPLDYYQNLGHQQRGSRQRLRDVAGSLSPAEVALLESLYLLEIESVDRRVGALLRALELTGQRARTLIVFTADHGEEFAEHGGFLHDHAMWDEVVRVPLMIAGPGVRRGYRARQPVSHVDLMPTLAELLGAGGLGPYQGSSLAPVLSGERDEMPSRPIYLSSTISHDQEAILRDSFKLIVRTADGAAELYDLLADPRERRDLAAEQPVTVAALRRALAAVHAENEAAWQERLLRDRPELRDEAARETEKNLRSLGYVD